MHCLSATGYESHMSTDMFSLLRSQSILLTMHRMLMCCKYNNMIFSLFFWACFLNFKCCFLVSRSFCTIYSILQSTKFMEIHSIRIENRRCYCLSERKIFNNSWFLSRWPPALLVLHPLFFSKNNIINTPITCILDSI